jgi:hypothetical protein
MKMASETTDFLQEELERRGIYLSRWAPLIGPAVFLAGGDGRDG